MNGSLSDHVRRLARMHASTPSVLSVYLTLPINPIEGARGLPARLNDLLADIAAQADAEPDHVRRCRLRADLGAVRDTLAAQAPKWVGHGLAVFASSELRLFDVLRLPGPVPERAVLGTRPHLRPLLSVIQGNPPYCVVVVERRNAWLYHVADGSIRFLRRLHNETPRSASFAGWYGLEEYRARDHAAELLRQHFRRTIDALAAITRRDPCDLLVIGGHADGVAEFRAMLPRRLGILVAGTFAVDPHAMTTAEVMAQAARVVTAWTTGHEQDLAAQAVGGPTDGIVTGLARCLDAAAGHAIDTLLVADHLRRAGHVCLACRAPTTRRGRCRWCRENTRPVPDVVDELVARVLDDGGRVETAVTDAGPVARLRHPIAGAAATSLSAR